MTSQDFHNWCKLEFLTMRGSEFLRSLFKKSWQTKFNKVWNSSTSGKVFINGVGNDVYQEAFRDQRKLLEQGDIDKWDLSLLRNALVNTSLLKNKQERKNVNELTGIRNKLAHHSSKCISDTEFEDYWNKISQLLCDLGDSKEELEELKTSLRSNKIALTQSQNIKKATELKLEGNKAFSAKDYSKAIEYYTEAIVLPDIPSSDLAILYSNRSASYLEKHFNKKTQNENDAINALEDAKNSKKQNPDWFKAYTRLGNAYEVFNQLDKAINAYERALLLEPNKEEIKTALSTARKNRGAQNRNEHLDIGKYGVSHEQIIKQFQESLGKDVNIPDVEELKKFAISLNPVLEYVCKGHDYRDGNGVKQDYAKAAEYYGIAVSKGSAEAMYNLAHLTREGLGVKKNYALAWGLLKKAAEQPPYDTFDMPTVGVAEAEHSIGMHYLEGIHVDKNELLAAEWFERAVEHGSKRSANNLGKMYMDGIGVSTDLKRAEQFFLLAASRGDHNAMDNLVALYVKLENLQKIKEWQKKALESGSLTAISKQEAISTVLSDLQAELDKYGVEEWEKANNLSSDNLSVPDRIQRKVTGNNPKLNTLFENSQRLLSELNTPKTALKTTPKRVDKKNMFPYDIEELKLWSQKSVTAKTMYEAMNHFLSSFNALMKISASKEISFFNESCQKFVVELAMCYRIEHIVASFPLEMAELAKEIANNVISHIHSLKEKQNLDKRLLELDQDARVCIAGMSLGNPKFIIEFLSESLKKYPNNKEFLYFRGSAYAFEQKYEEALRDHLKFLELEPENYDVLYFKAVDYRLMNSPKAIEAYEKFLVKAPADHRKVPEAYYAMGACAFTRNELSDKAKISNASQEAASKYYELGLEHEEKQLPCFLPYESNSKKALELCLKPEMLFEEKKESNSSPAEKIKLKDPLRKELILLHRRTINQWRIMKGLASRMSSTHTAFKMSFKPPKKQKLASLIGLKAIYLNEIDWTKDKVLTGYVLELTAIDVPHNTEQSIQFVAEDNNEHVQRVALYNTSPDEIKELGVGSKFSIINPYIRMALDGKPLIRVDDPSSVIWGEKGEKMCALCGNLSAKFQCGKCNTTDYCSKACQERDWKEFQHKLICTGK